MTLKNSSEIDRIRDSCKLLAEVFQKIEALIDVGITTKEINRFAHDLIVKNKGIPAFLNYQGFPASVCISLNEEVIHGIPSARKLESGDVVSLDIGINLKGYFSDAARTFAVGKISPAARQLLKVTEECLYLGIDAAKVGNRVHDISKAVYNHARKHNYGVVREFCGHGVGLSLHEEPQIPNYVGLGPNPRLKAGMVLALEPMINLGGTDIFIEDDDWTVVTADNKISAHFEHTIAIFEDHTEILTTVG